MRSILAIILLIESIQGFQFLLQPIKQFCITKEPHLDFDLLIDMALSSDNPKALMDI